MNNRFSVESKKMKIKVESKHILIILAIQFLLSALFGVGINFLKGSEWVIMLSYGLAQLSYVIAMILVVRFMNIDFFESVPIRKKPNLIGVGLMLVVAIAIIMQNTLIANGFSYLMGKINVAMNVPIPDVKSAWYIGVFAFIVIGIFPALIEEVMFRGLLVTAINKRGMVYAMLVSGCVFALAHANVAQLVHQFIVGVVLAYIVIKSGNIWYAIIVHLVNNGIALFLSEWKWYESLSDMSLNSIYSMLGLMFGGFMLLIIALFIFDKFVLKNARGMTSLRKKANKFDELIKRTKTKEKEQFMYSNSGDNDMNNIFNNDITKKDVVTHSSNSENSDDEEKIIDKALANLKAKPGKLVDIYILGICLFYAIVMIITAIGLSYS